MKENNTNMRTIIKIFLITTLFISAIFYLRTEKIYAGRAVCDVFIYIANNSLFDCRLQIDGIDQTGSLLQGKAKVYTVQFLNETPKRIKVKIFYDDPDYIEPKSYFMVTKKLECGQTDSIYIRHTK